MQYALQNSMKNAHTTKKIAIVSDAIYPYNNGGKEKRIYEISTRLAQQGYDVHIYCMKWWKNKETIRQEQGITLHGISKYYPLYNGQRRSIKQAVFFALACFKLIREDFDVIDVDHMPHLVLFPIKIVCLIKEKKLYATWNEVWGKQYWKKYLGTMGNIAALIEWLSARMPDEIIAVSAHTKTKLIEDLHIKTPITVIPNGIDLQAIKNVKPSKKKSDCFFAGRLLSHKNVDVLIQTVKLLQKDYPKITASIIGTGPEKEKLIALTKKHKLQKNITFYDFLPAYSDLYALMKSTKVFVFPSTREGFGIVALEANACDIPVITTNHADNATKDLIKNGKNGYVTALNPKSFAEKIKLSLEKPYKNNKKDILQYDWNTIEKQVQEVYHR